MRTGPLHFRIWSVSKVSLFEESSSLLWKNNFQFNAAKEFFKVLLDWKFVDFFKNGNKIQALTENWFFWIRKW